MADDEKTEAQAEEDVLKKTRASSKKTDTLPDNAVLRTKAGGGRWKSIGGGYVVPDTD